jgi:branched-chain amino acid transport system substrate-binding protein
MKRFGLMALILCGFVAAAFGGGRKDRDIVIGGILSLSGSAGILGLEVRNGIDLAVAEINNNGGVNGRRLNVQVQDDRGDPQEAAAIFTQMTGKQKIKMIIGSSTTACTAAIAPMAQAKKILLLTPSATGENITDGGNFVFRTCFTDFDQGNVAGVFAGDSEGLARVKAAIIRNGSASATQTAEAFSSSFKALGGSIVADEVYSSGNLNFNDMALRVKVSEPEVIFVSEENYAVAVQILAAIKAQGIRGPIIGLDSWEGIVRGSALKLERRNPNSYYFLAHFAPDSLSPLAADFTGAYELSYGVPPLSHAALGYDSVYLIRDALRNTPKPDNGLLVRDSLAQISGEYITGRISFSGTRDPKKPRLLLQIMRSGDGLMTMLAYNVPQ